MDSCGKLLGGMGGYRKICGHIWNGGIAQCNECRKRDLEEENLILQNKLLKKRLIKEETK